MVEEPFNLSQKIFNDGKVYMGDVKTAIRLLKEDLCKELLIRGDLFGLDRIPQETIIKKINERFGEYLI